MAQQNVGGITKIVALTSFDHPDKDTGEHVRSKQYATDYAATYMPKFNLFGLSASSN